MSDAAERIAAAVRALRRTALNIDDADVTADLARAAAGATVVDVDALRRAHLGEQLDLSEVVLSPVWTNVLFGYRQQFADSPDWYTNLTHYVAWESADDAVGRWTAVISHYTVVDAEPAIPKVLNGRLVLAIEDDGRVSHWSDVDPNGGPLTINDQGRAEMDRRLFAPVFALNLLNCRNVVVVSDPPRPRGTARRIARTGVTVSEIHITPTGTTRIGRGDVRTIPADSVPLHSVRGHAAEYGVNGKGLLFGRIAGRFWIPQHVRGRVDNGTVDQSYVVEAPDWPASADPRGRLGRPERN